VCDYDLREAWMSLDCRRGSGRYFSIRNNFIRFDSQILHVLRIQEDLNEKSEIRQIANLILLHFSCAIAQAIDNQWSG